MRRERNLFVEAFGALYALHWLVLPYIVVNCTITIVDTWFEDGRYFVYLYAPLGSVFYFLMFGRLLKAANPQRSLKQFATFSVWYLCIFFVFTVGGADLVLYLFEAAPETIVEQGSFIAGFFIFTLLLLFAPTYFLGTLLPAKILKRSDSFRAALQRALRQAGYLLPRYVGIYVPLLLVSGILYGAMQEGGPNCNRSRRPVTFTY
nr:hypothetical protein [uncultured Roseibium sp.]